MHRFVLFRVILALLKNEHDVKVLGVFLRIVELFIDPYFFCIALVSTILLGSLILLLLLLFCRRLRISFVFGVLYSTQGDAHANSQGAVVAVSGYVALFERDDRVSKDHVAFDD